MSLGLTYFHARFQRTRPCVPCVAFSPFVLDWMSLCVGLHQLEPVDPSTTIPIGSMISSDDEKRRLAAEAATFNAGDRTFVTLFPHLLLEPEEDLGGDGEGDLGAPLTAGGGEGGDTGDGAEGEGGSGGGGGGGGGDAGVTSPGVDASADAK